MYATSSPHGTGDGPRFDEAWPEVAAKIDAAVKASSRSVMVVLTKEPPGPVAEGVYVLLEPFANVVFAVGPTEIAVTADEHLLDSTMDELLVRANELARTHSVPVVLSYIADEIGRRWPAVRPPPIPAR